MNLSIFGFYLVRRGSLEAVVLTVARRLGTDESLRRLIRAPRPLRPARPRRGSPADLAAEVAAERARWAGLARLPRIAGGAPDEADDLAGSTVPGGFVAGEVLPFTRSVEAVRVS